MRASRRLSSGIGLSVGVICLFTCIQYQLQTPENLALKPFGHIQKRLIDGSKFYAVLRNFNFSRALLFCFRAGCACSVIVLR